MLIETLAQRYHVLPERVRKAEGRLLRHVAIMTALYPPEDAP